jgi:hypothetical protein
MCTLAFDDGAAVVTDSAGGIFVVGDKQGGPTGPTKPLDYDGYISKFNASKRHRRPSQTVASKVRCLKYRTCAGTRQTIH